MSKKSKIYPITTANIDLLYIFRYCHIKVACSMGYNLEECKQIQNIVNQLSKKIIIDKSYVDYKGTKYTKTFITESGWNVLKNLVLKTKLTKNCSKYQHHVIQTSYELLIISYIYQCLQDLSYNILQISLSIENNASMMSEVQFDTIKSWKNYPGKWQLWKNN